MKRLFLCFCSVWFLLLAGCDSDVSKNVEEPVEFKNPIKEFKLVEEAEAEAGFYCPMPTVLPRGYSLKSISTISGKIIQIVYHTQGRVTINYRVSKGSEDVSGINGSFKTRLLNVDSTEVLARLSGSRIVYATWQRENQSFAVSFDKPVTEAVFIRFLESIPTMSEAMEMEIAD